MEIINEPCGTNAKSRGKTKLTPDAIKRMSEKLKGRRLTPEHRQNISKATKGKKKPEWVRQKFLVAKKNISEETRRRMSESALKRPKCKPISEETRKRMSDAQSKLHKTKEHREKMTNVWLNHPGGRGHKGHYNGFYCASSWELMFYIFCIDNNKTIKRNVEWFPYTYKGKLCKFLPDFIVDGRYVEVKGFRSDVTDAKISSFPHPIDVLYEEDLKPVFEHFKKKFYGILPKTLYDENQKDIINENNLTQGQGGV